MISNHKRIHMYLIVLMKVMPSPHVIIGRFIVIITGNPATLMYYLMFVVRSVFARKGFTSSYLEQPSDNPEYGTRVRASRFGKHIDKRSIS